MLIVVSCGLCSTQLTIVDHVQTATDTYDRVLFTKTKFCRIVQCSVHVLIKSYHTYESKKNKWLQSYYENKKVTQLTLLWCSCCGAYKLHVRLLLIRVAKQWSQADRRRTVILHILHKIDQSFPLVGFTPGWFKSRFFSFQWVRLGGLYQRYHMLMRITVRLPIEAAGFYPKFYGNSQNKFWEYHQNKFYLINKTPSVTRGPVSILRYIKLTKISSRACLDSL